MTDVSDDFNRDGPELGDNWTVHNGFADLVILSNTVSGSVANAHCVSYWNANSFQDDQFVEATLSGVLSGSFAGLVLRAQASGFYVAYFGITDLDQVLMIFRWDGAVATQLAALTINPSSWIPGDVLRFEIAGSELTAKRNGVTLLTATDETYSNGSPGLNFYQFNFGGVAVDDWVAGPLVSADLVPIHLASVFGIGKAARFIIPSAEGVFGRISMRGGQPKAALRGVESNVIVRGNWETDQ